MSAAPSSCERTTQAVGETVALGRLLGESLVGGVVIALTGPLGSGKTHLVKGIAEGNAVSPSDGRATSPTFALIHEYSGRLPLYHLDAYRLQSTREFIDLGFDELCRPDCAVLVEWADRVSAVLPANLLKISIHATETNTRRITIEASGPNAMLCLSNLRDQTGDA